MNDVRPVVLSGGAGSRLWPLSQESRPKQFLDLLGAESLFQKTLSRMMAIPGSSHPLIVTGSDYLAMTVEGLGALDADIVLEPQGRNTAAAILAAALLLPADHVMVVTPSDHLVADEASFVDAVCDAISMARDGGIGTLGVVPDRPDTGFGYIKKGEPRGAGFEIERFVEKPARELAATMAGDGAYFWNAGLFVGQAGVILSEARTHCPDIVAVVEAAIPPEAGGVIHLSDEFLGVASSPFDKAIMEVTDLGFVVPLDAGWTDVGSWKSVWDASGKDADGNAIIGPVEVLHTKGSYLSSSSRPVMVIGLTDVAVIATDHGVLVTTLDRSQDVRDLVVRLNNGESGDTVE